MESLKKYISNTSNVYSSGIATEHSYRPALLDLFKELTNLEVTNEPKRSEFGAPDFMFKNKNIVYAHAEAKDTYVNLDEIEKSEQMNRYYGYPSIILTNSLEFRFYKNGQKYCDTIKIAKIENNKIVGIEENYPLFEKTIQDFIKDSSEPIKSGLVLAKLMAGKAIRIRDNIKAYLSGDNTEKNKDLLSVYETIKKLLLSELDVNKFADMYAQTVVYGLFVARYYDESQDNFSRQEARDLIPPSNPFLRHFFDHIAGPSFDKRIEWIVNELCEEFNHTDVKAIIHNYYKIAKDDSRDPIIHFYEDFLKEYDAKERMALGVFYTPLPVVRFIVRSIDQILKKDFNLAKGLADNSKIEVERIKAGKKGKEQIHKVQLLDPATGTGTFLNEVIDFIHKGFEGQEGRWKGYIKEDLLPRLNGFELMIASYTIAHLKLSMTLKESGADTGDERIRVYLTNSLDREELPENTLFADLGLGKAITDESREANRVKNELPIMVVLGNPPYSGISMNKNYTDNNVYKVEPGGLQKLQERKNWLDDDYVKFIRLAESMIEKTGEGVVGMITSHGYIDNPTFRGMRWHLRNTFDTIYVVDLHGNSNKKETNTDGTKDENIFDIKTGVSIFFGIKNTKTKNKKLAQVYQTDFYGIRDEKYKKLNSENLETIKWNKLPENVEVWRVEGEGKDEYKKGFSVAELFSKNTTGIVTMGDSFIIDQNKEILIKRVDEFLNNEISESVLKEKYSLGKNYAKWVIDNKKKIENNHNKVVSLAYRPFDERFTYYDKNLVWRTRDQTMNQLVNKQNIGFVASKINRQASLGYFFITKTLTDFHILDNAQDSTSVFPLYLYSEDGLKTPNLKKEIIDEIEKIIGKVTPENILDYIYAVLYSPSYRTKYKEFIKIDFPRVPYPTDKKQFNELIRLGEELRHLHLLESDKLSKPLTTYSIAGSDTVEKISYEDGKVFINKEQYFGNVPEIAWNFYIGGYQPAQKWLKDRKGRKLSGSDIEHYQKIIIALVETIRIMGEIDKIKV
jgi:predicted helicase